jgi:Ca2+-binding EF-hand superfamily protein
MATLLESTSFDQREDRDKMVFFYHDKDGDGLLLRGELLPALQASGALISKTELDRMLGESKFKSNEVIICVP